MYSIVNTDNCTYIHIVQEKKKDKFRSTKGGLLRVYVTHTHTQETINSSVFLYTRKRKTFQYFFVSFLFLYWDHKIIRQKKIQTPWKTKKKNDSIDTQFYLFRFPLSCDDVLDSLKININKQCMYVLYQKIFLMNKKIPLKLHQQNNTDQRK